LSAVPLDEPDVKVMVAEKTPVLRPVSVRVMEMPVASLADVTVDLVASL